jgi:hypothetical protein
VGLSHTSLINYYKTIFALVQHHKYSIAELENLMPFERDIYVDMLKDYLEELEEKRKE